MKLKIKYIFIISALLLTQLCFIQQVTGQEKKQVQAKSLYHFEDLQRKQTWTDSYNAAGLHFIDFNNSSFVEAYMGKNDGSFVKYNESDNSFNFGLKTASYTKIKKTTFYGKIDYNNFTGQNMTSSGLIYPERYLLSVADNRPAEKRKESYQLSGGFSSPITSNFIFGMQINYETANLAKMKDLRHKTDLLDLEVTGGLVYKTDFLNVGANYYYRKFYENVTFSKVAEDEILYTGYLFKGLWFGVFDIWSQSGLRLSRPFTDVVNGGSLQLEFVKDNIRFHNEFTYKSQEGMTGPGADRAYSQSEAVSYEYKGKIQYETPETRHYLKFKTNYTEAVGYDKITNQEIIGGITIVYYYGLNKTFSKNTFDFNAEYEIAIGKHKFNPIWNIRAGYQYSSIAALSSLITPFYFSQDIRITSGFAKANRNFVLNKAMVDISLLGSYSSGSGIKLEEHISSTAPSTISREIIPKQATNLLNREYEFLTTPKFLGEVGLRYSRFVSSKSSIGSVYLDLKYSFTKANELKYHADNKAGIFYMALGYSF